MERTYCTTLDSKSGLIYYGGNCGALNESFYF